MLLACPKYMFTHNASDGVHIPASAEQWLGEYYAKAYYTAVVQGQTWVPLYPLSVTRSGTTITVVFSRGGLVFDTTIVSDPTGSYPSLNFSGAATTVAVKYGFEFVDDTSTANITGSPTISARSACPVMNPVSCLIWLVKHQHGELGEL